MKDQPINKRLVTDKRPALEKYFRAVIKMEASDLHLKGNEIPRIRTSGQLRQTTGEAISETRVEEMIFEVLTEEQNLQLDFSLSKRIFRDAF